MTVRYSGFNYDHGLGLPEMTDIVAQNPLLVQKLKSTRHLYTKDVAFNASYRQSARDDKHYAQINNNGSCFLNLRNLCNALKIEFDTLLLADVHNRAGDSFITATTPELAAKVPIQNGWLRELSGIIIAYAHMQEASIREPNEEVEYFFHSFDKNILEAVYRFFLNHRELIPTDVCLKLIYYRQNPDNSHTLEDYETTGKYLFERDTSISGRGTTNRRWRQTIRAFGDQVAEHAKNVFDDWGNKLTADDIRHQEKYNCTLEFDLTLPSQADKFSNNFDALASFLKLHEKSIEKVHNDLFFSGYYKNIEKLDFSPAQKSFLYAWKLDSYGFSSEDDELYKLLLAKSPLFTRLKERVQNLNSAKNSNPLFNTELESLLSDHILRFAIHAQDVFKPEPVVSFGMRPVKSVDGSKHEQFNAEFARLDSIEENIGRIATSVLKANLVARQLKAIQEQSQYAPVKALAAKSQQLLTLLSSQLRASSKKQIADTLTALTVNLPLIVSFTMLTENILSLYFTSMFGNPMDGMLRSIDSVLNAIFNYYANEGKTKTYSEHSREVFVKISEAVKEMEINLANSRLPTLFKHKDVIQAEQLIGQFFPNYKKEMDHNARMWS